MTGVQTCALPISGTDVVVRLPLGETDRVVVTDQKGAVICTAVANWFGETGDLKLDVEKVRKARKANLEALERFGAGKIAPQATGATFITIAEAAERPRTIEFPAPPENMAPLALAAGAERDAAPASIINPLDM